MTEEGMTEVEGEIRARTAAQLPTYDIILLDGSWIVGAAHMEVTKI